MHLLDIFTLNHWSEGSILWGPWSCRAGLRSLGTHAPMMARWTPLFMQRTVIIHHYSCPYPQSQSVSTSSPSGHKHQLLTLCACSPTRPIIHLLFTRTPPRPLVLTLVHEWVSHKRLENPSMQDSRCDTGHGVFLSSALKRSRFIELLESDMTQSSCIDLSCSSRHVKPTHDTAACWCVHMISAAGAAGAAWRLRRVQLACWWFLCGHQYYSLSKLLHIVCC